MRTVDELLKLFPSWYLDVVEIEALCLVEQDLLQAILTKIDEIQNNQFVATADSNTLKLYEQLLGIRVYEGDSLENRRFRVFSRLTSRKPYTERYFDELLHTFGDKVNFIIDFNNYQLDIVSSFDEEIQMQEMDFHIKSVIPANIVVTLLNDLKAKTAQDLYQGLGFINCEIVVLGEEF